jgi:DNA (cytosine-5)-methyltransferase 1
MADYGVPQTRKRLITLGLKQSHTHEPRQENLQESPDSFLHPVKTHGTPKTPHITLRECFKNLSVLDAHTKRFDEYDKFHTVPKWNEMQYFCMSNTPEGQTAFNNKACVQCMKEANDLQQVKCNYCHAILPRPYTTKNDQLRLIKAFKTSYRRMRFDKPGNALTTNSGVISSDVKGHPAEHRVLSLREIMILATIGDYQRRGEEYFSFDFGSADEKLIRDVIGECIPPLMTYKIVTQLQTLETVNEL